MAAAAARAASWTACDVGEAGRPKLELVRVMVGRGGDGDEGRRPDELISER